MTCWGDAGIRARDFIGDYGVAPGRRIVVVTNNDDAYRTALRRWMRGLRCR